MYIPSIYASVNTYNCILGNNTIATTNINYTRLTVPGIKSLNATGFGSYFYVVEQTTATNISVPYIANPYGVPAAQAVVVVQVEEFVPFFFRRPFYHSFGIIQTQQLTATVATGIVFGPKAFVISKGWVNGYGNSGSLEITDAQMWSVLTLDKPSGVLTMTRKEKDYAGNPGPLYHWFTIIDPW